MGLTQHWEYLLLNIMGGLFLIGFAGHTARRNSLNRRNRLLYIAGIALTFLAGGRLFYLLFYADPVNPSVHFFMPEPYGFSLYGGLILVVFYFTISAWFSRIPVWHWLDEHTPGLMGCVVLDKTGCFFNGCCFGTPTIMPWGIPYTPESQAYNYYIVQALKHLQEQSWQVYSNRIHPVQLYESGIALILLFIAVHLLRKKARPGLVFLLTAGLYSLVRLWLFYLKANPETGTFLHLLPWLYIIIAGLSLGVLLIKIINTNPVRRLDEPTIKMGN